MTGKHQDFMPLLADRSPDGGVDLLRLHRGALGRDPVGGEMAALRHQRQMGRGLDAMARDLLATAEAVRVHGDATGPADAAFVVRALRGAAGGAACDLTLVPALVGRSRAECLADLAATPLFTDDAAPMPALYIDRRPDDPDAYAFWIRHCERPPVAPPSGRQVRIVMMSGDTTIEDAARTAGTLAAQSHTDWQLVLIGPVVSPWARAVLARMLDDARVRHCDGGSGVAEAISTAPDIVGLMAPGDLLAAGALRAVLQPFEAASVGMVYTDEDEMDARGARRRPRFKPMACDDAMLVGNAIGQLAVYRAAVVAAVGGFRADAAPYAAWDLARRVWAHDPAGVVHLPQVLFHGFDPPHDWPVPARVGRETAELAVVGGDWPRVVPKGAVQPLVSVVIPTRDRADLLAAVTDGVLHRTGYPALEVVIVDHATTEPDAVALLRRLAEDPRVRVLPYAGAFNFAAMNNRAADVARGEVLVLLNNDIEVADPGWLSELALHAMRPGVGIVAARLLDRAGMLQHGGMALGPEGRATHLFRGAARDDPGYLGMLAVTRDVAAVTGACLAIRRAVWRAVGGMQEALPVTWNDVDLCQRVRAAGLRIVWTPHAVLTHLEGETRGSDAVDPARLAAFEADRLRYRALWGAAADADPFVDANLVATDHELNLGMPPR